MRFAGHETSSCRIERAGRKPHSTARSVSTTSLLFLVLCGRSTRGRSVFVETHTQAGIHNTPQITTQKGAELDVFDRVLFSVEVREVFV